MLNKHEEVHSWTVSCHQRLSNPCFTYSSFFFILLLTVSVAIGFGSIHKRRQNFRCELVYFKIWMVHKISVTPEPMYQLRTEYFGVITDQNFLYFSIFQRMSRQRFISMFIIIIMNSLVGQHITSFDVHNILFSGNNILLSRHLITSSRHFLQKYNFRINVLVETSHPWIFLQQFYPDFHFCTKGLIFGLKRHKLFYSSIALKPNQWLFAKLSVPETFLLVDFDTDECS